MRYQIVDLVYNPVTKLSTVTYQNPPTGAPFAVASNNRVIIGLASKKDLPSLNGGWTVQNFVAAAAGATGTFQIPYTLPNGLTTIPTSAYVKNQGYSTITPYNGAFANLAFYGTRSTHSTFSDSRGTGVHSGSAHWPRFWRKGNCGGALSSFYLSDYAL